MTIRLAMGFAVAMAGPLMAQDVTPPPFTLADVSLSPTRSFDAAYAERTGAGMDVFFSLRVPLVDGVAEVLDETPEGGVAKFSFAAEGEDGTPVSLIENFHIVPASIGMAPGAENPVETRIAAAARLLNDEAWPLATRGFADAQILSSQWVRRGDNIVVELLGTYTDPATGPMFLRAALVLNAELPASYLVLNNVNQRLAPVADETELGGLLSTKMLETFRYD